MNTLYCLDETAKNYIFSGKRPQEINNIVFLKKRLKRKLNINPNYSLTFRCKHFATQMAINKLTKRLADFSKKCFNGRFISITENDDYQVTHFLFRGNAQIICFVQYNFGSTVSDRLEAAQEKSKQSPTLKESVEEKIRFLDFVKANRFEDFMLEKDE